MATIALIQSATVLLSYSAGLSKLLNSKIHRAANPIIRAITMNQAKYEKVYSYGFELANIGLGWSPLWSGDLVDVLWGAKPIFPLTSSWTL